MDGIHIVKLNLYLLVILLLKYMKRHYIIREKRKIRTIGIALIGAFIASLPIFGIMHSMNTSHAEAFSIKSYIGNNINSKYATGVALANSPIVRLMSVFTGKSNDPVDTGHTMLVNYTLCRADEVQPDDDYDSIFETEEKQRDTLLTSYQTLANIYDIGDDNYWVAFIDSTQLNGAARYFDVRFANWNTNGEVVNTIKYDDEAGIAYIPKTEFQNEDGEEIARALQAQLMLSYDISNTNQTTPLNVNIVNEKENVSVVAQQETVDVPALDTTVTVPVISQQDASKVSLNNFDVYLGDSEYTLTNFNSDTAYYDKETGELTFSISGVAHSSVRIVVRKAEQPEPSINLARFNNADKSALSKQTIGVVTNVNALKTFPDGAFNNINSDTNLEVGSCFDYRDTVYYDYDGDNVVEAGWTQDAVDAKNAYGGYAYSWTNNTDYGSENANKQHGTDHRTGALMDLIWNGTTWSTLQGYGGVDGPLVYDGTAIWQNLYFVFRLPHGNISVLDDDRHNPSTHWTANFDGLTGKYAPGYCAHVSQGNKVTSGGSTGTIRGNILYVDYASQYVVIGFITPCLGNQTGTVIYKFKIGKKEEPKKAKLYVQKRAKGTAPAGASFAGARYNIYRDTNSGTGDGSGRQEIACDPLVTNASGYAISSEIEEGWYWVHETPPDASAAVSKYYELDYEHGCGKRPVWYKAGTVPWYKPNDNGWYHVYAKASDLPNGSPIAYQNGNSSIKWVYETPLTGSITLQKTDDGGRNLGSGFSFQLYRNSVSSSNKVGGVKSTSSSGKVEWTGLAPGRYIIKEVTAKFPYLLNNGQVTVNVTAGSTQSLNPTIEFENDEQTTGQVTIYKRDANTNSLLSGFRFKIRKGSSSGAYLTVSGVSQWTTGSSGSVTITGIPFGTYYVEEVGVPSKSNYTFADGTERFTISASSEAATKAVVTFYNEKNYGEIELTKVDTDNSNRPISGAQFALYADEAISNDSGTWYSSGQRISTQTTGSDGKITWTNLPLKSDGTAKYRIEEVNVPSPYVCLTKTQQVTISKGNSRVATKYVTIGNEQARGEVSLIKKDEKGNLIEGAKFELRAAENVVVNGQTIYTNNHGR